MTAWLVVRAELHDPGRRDEFDRWYRDEHLPDAKAAFEARSAWRGWSVTDPQVHFAFYEFADARAALAATGGEAITALIAEFDAAWGTAVTRTREVVERVQAL